MLKTWKKAVSLVLVFAMSMMVCVPAFAAEKNDNLKNKSLSEVVNEIQNTLPENSKINVTDGTINVFVPKLIRSNKAASDNRIYAPSGGSVIFNLYQIQMYNHTL